MKIVIDSNRVLAAMIKESTTREILFDKTFDFIAPDYLISEVRNHKDKVIKATGITDNQFEILLSLIFEYIIIVPEKDYTEFIENLKNEIKDPKDLSYFAVCLAAKADGIWTHDPHFKEQNNVKVFTNIDMLKISGKVRQ